MNNFKKIAITTKRKPVQSIIIFLCVFLLGTVMSSSISVAQAIRNTDDALRRQLPAVATIIIDDELLSSYITDNLSYDKKI